MKTKIIGFILFAVVFTGCEEDSDFWHDHSGLYHPDCDVISVQKFEKDPYHYFPRLRFIVRNDEDGATAYAVGGDIKFKVGNTIIERGVFSLGTLQRGESIVEEENLSRFNSHSEYTSCVIRIQWSDINGRIYEKVVYR